MPTTIEASTGPSTAEVAREATGVPHAETVSPEIVSSNLGAVATDSSLEVAPVSSPSEVGAEPVATSIERVATPKPPTWKDWKQAGEGKSPQEIQEIGDARRKYEADLRRGNYIDSMRRL